MGRPVVNTNPVANQYADKAIETIVEFNNGKAGGPGGLISFRRLDDGSLTVSLYRLDEGIDVIVDPAVVVTENIPHGALAAWWRDLTDEERALTGIGADQETD